MESQIALERIRQQRHDAAMRRDLRDTCIAHMAGKMAAGLMDIHSRRTLIANLVVAADEIADAAYPRQA